MDRRKTWWEGKKRKNLEEDSEETENKRKRRHTDRQKNRQTKLGAVRERKTRKENRRQIGIQIVIVLEGKIGGKGRRVKSWGND